MKKLELNNFFNSNLAKGLSVKKTCKFHGDYQAEIRSLGDKTYFSSCSLCLTEQSKLDKRKYIEDMRLEGLEAQIKSLSGEVFELKMFQKCKFENFIVSNNLKEKYLRTAKNFVENFKKHQENQTVGVWEGKPGNGKTHLAYAIVNELIRKGYSCAITSFPMLARKFKLDDFAGKREFEEMFLNYSQVDFLVIDELGAITEADAQKIQLKITELINIRYERCAPTLLVGNNVDVSLDARVISRIGQNNFCIKFADEDFRQQLFKKNKGV